MTGHVVVGHPRSAPGARALGTLAHGIDPNGNGSVPGAALDEAWRHSPFARLDDATRTLLLEHAELERVASGEVIQRGDETPRVSLIVDGVVRVLATTSHGRRAAFRYAQAGECIGLICSIVRQHNVEAEAFTPCVVLRIDADWVRALAQRHPALSWSIAESAAQTASTVMEAAGRSMFDNIRARVAWHLLDMADSVGGELIVRANQWEVAESVGSVRDVVARAMNELRREGLIARMPQGWALLDPSRLHREARGDTRPDGAVAQGTSAVATTA